MPRKPPPPHPKGTPRTPGSGRKRGTPNRTTVAMRELMVALLEDVEYQHRLRQDFRKRRVHPSIEALIWQMHLGKPKQQVEVAATVKMNEKLATERERLRCLDVADLEKLLADSEALVERAVAQAQTRTQGSATKPPQPNPTGQAQPQPQRARKADTDAPPD